MVGEDEIALNLDFEGCYHLILIGFRSGTTQMKYNQFSNTRWTIDRNGVTQRGWHSKVTRLDDSSVDTLSFLIPLRQFRQFQISWVLPDFGNVVLKADHDGFAWSSPNAGQLIDLYIYTDNHQLSIYLSILIYSSSICLLFYDQ